MNARRTYTMTTRAERAEETRRRILHAAFELQSQRLTSEIGLDAVAAHAEVSVQTVLRHFGSRANLFDATVTYANQLVAEERTTPVGDVPAAMRVLADHYEKRGDLALNMLAQESAHPRLRQVADAGKVMHRRWVAEVFGPYLPDGDSAREELLDLLVIATDVYAWKLMRRDRGHSRAQTLHRLEAMVDAVLAGTHGKDTPR